MIKIEIDPNLSSTASDFSTMTFQPSNTASNAVERLHRRDHGSRLGGR